MSVKDEPIAHKVVDGCGKDDTDYTYKYIVDTKRCKQGEKDLIQDDGNHSRQMILYPSAPIAPFPVPSVFPGEPVIEIEINL